MTFNHAVYNAKFLTHPGENDSLKYGVVVTPANVLAGVTYWRCIGIHHLTGEENRGNHHVYADVLDEGGKRLNGSVIAIRNNNLPESYAKIDKSANEAGTNIPMHWDDTLAVYVFGELPGDWVTGLNIRHEDEEVGNTRGHHSFYVVWQRTVKTREAPPIPPEPPGKTSKVWTIPLLSKPGEIEVGINVKVWPW